MSAYHTAPRGTQPVNSRRRNGTTKPPPEPVPEPPEVAVRVAPRAEDGVAGPRARVLVMLRNGVEVEITRSIVAAIAHALWEMRGEDHLKNWIDAESVFNQLTEAKAPTSASVPRAGRAVPMLSDDDDDDLLPPTLLRRGSRSRRL